MLSQCFQTFIVSSEKSAYILNDFCLFFFFNITSVFLGCFPDYLWILAVWLRCVLVVLFVFILYEVYWPLGVFQRLHLQIFFFPFSPGVLIIVLLLLCMVLNSIHFSSISFFCSDSSIFTFITYGRRTHQSV